MSVVLGVGEVVVEVVVDVVVEVVVEGRGAAV